MTITSTIISSILDGVAFGKKTHHGSLTMFPLRSKGDGGLEYLTLAEALEAGFARISEVSEGAACRSSASRTWEACRCSSSMARS